MRFLPSPRSASWSRRLLVTSSSAAILVCAHTHAGWAQSASQTTAAGTVVQISTQTAAAAAPQVAAAASETAPEAITVTGTRITSPGLVSPNPIETITSVDIEQTGLQNLSELLAQRPEFMNNQTPSNSPFFVNGANIDAANLRGLGAYRTLTLIDGVRQVGQLSGVNNSGGTGIVDLNTIPPLLIDSIDVVTGGESAVYGADAVAGVLNFKLKRNFEGAEATAEYGTTTDGGGTTTSFDGIFGANFAHDRGNITFTTDYSNTAAINGFERPTLATGGGSIFTQDGPNRLVCCFAQGFLNQSGAPVIQTQIGNNAPNTLTFNTSGTALQSFNAGTTIPGFGPNVVFAGTGQALVNPTQSLTAGDLRFVD
ncbi:MAG: hypothetical protein QOJ54_1123, partial [Aliidongia sp.]|nr:hypothetical protein [Aliidongia sp.]